MNLNDTAPLALPFVTPDAVRSLAVEAYVTVASTAILLWDVIVYAPEDWRQIRVQGFLKVSRLIYCFSRLTTIIYMIGLSVVLTAPIRNCAWVAYVGYIYPSTVPITILLFLFRIYALFRNRSYILVFVFLSWLLVLGSAIAVSVRTEGTNINGSAFCTTKTIERDISDAVSTLTRFLHDTLVFIVMSVLLFRQKLREDNHRRGGVTGFLIGKHLFALSRSILHDGQAYYLATLILNIVVIVLPLLPKPFVTPCTLGGPLFVLISNMACHVYRNLVDAKYRDCQSEEMVMDEEGAAGNNRRQATIG